MKIENMLFVFISVYHMFPSPSTVFVSLTPLWTRTTMVSNFALERHPEKGIIYRPNMTNHLVMIYRHDVFPLQGLPSGMMDSDVIIDEYNTFLKHITT